MSLTAQLLEEVKDIVIKGLRGHPAKVYLFGSRATGTARRASDVDVAILPTRPLPPGMLALIDEALEESHVPYRVDVVDLSTTDQAFRDRVLKEGILWNDSTND